MKKYGKYEKMPDGTRAKQPPAKSVLLQTYFTSLLCLVICVTMFLGTSYAWFTSEVNNTANEIYIGTLDVELEKELADGTWASLSALENDANKTNLFDKDIRWEPGYTALETIKVTNEGDLAFHYTLTFTDGKVADKANEVLQDDQWKEVAKHFDVWVYDYRANNNTASTAATYDEMIREDSGWEPVGTLTDVLSGKAILRGTMITVREKDQAKEAINEGTTDGVATEDKYTIALHMKEDADAAVMGHKISLNVKLIAYQMSKEQDGFGDLYDQMVATAGELEEALNNGGMVALAADIDLDNAPIAISKDVTAILDLNGHSITRKGDAGDSLIINNGNLTIVGDGKIAITFDGEEDNSKSVNAISNRGILTVNGGEISNTGKGNQIGYAIDNYNGAMLNVNGGKIMASGSGYYDGIRLFCGSNETVVTVNGGEISSIWAQNPSANKATAVKGTVIVNGGTIATVYYENYTTVMVADGVTVAVTPYGAGKDKTATESKDGYTVYSFVHE